MNNNIEFFNLSDGQSAVIRILATSVSKIERVAVHTIDTNNQGRKKHWWSFQQKYHYRRKF